jgi:AcrR family transcriptional regulator
MGTRERKQKEFEAREALFLNTARRLIREEGLLTLQMARLARECDYATGTLYQHFSSKEDLLVALATVRIEEHSEIFERVRAWPASTRERMFALGEVDQDFGRRHPCHEQLLQYVFTEVVWASASSERRSRLQQALEKPAGAVRAIVEEALANGDLDAQGFKPQELMLGPWGLCTGIQSMQQARGLLDHLGIDSSEDLLRFHSQAMLNGLGWQPLIDLEDRATLKSWVEKVRRELLHEPS